MKHLYGLGGGELENNGVQCPVPAKQDTCSHKDTGIGTENIVPDILAAFFWKINGKEVCASAAGIADQAKADGKAIDQDGYTWMNLLELKDQNKIWLKNGLDDAGGGGFLIAADGTILAVTPSAEQVESILKERLGD